VIPPSRKKTAAEIRELLKRPVKEEPPAEEDEEEELMRELAKIKADKLADEKTDIFSAAGKSWREDKVFDKKPAATGRVTMINDTLRSEFHRKFLDQYISS
jgi:protein CWC15